MGCVLTACSSNEVLKVNNAAMACYHSPSDEQSRQIAAGTLNKIVENENDYRVGADDVLSVSIFEWMVREKEKTVEVRVSENGFISLPLVGNVNVKDETIDRIETLLVTLLKDGGFIKSPRVEVKVREFRSKTIAVVGAVVRPDRYNLRQNVTTLLDVISLAGGISDEAGYELYVLRPGRERLDMGPKAFTDLETNDRDTLALAEAGDKEVIVIDTIELLERGNLDLNMVLSHGDVVYVPEAHKFFVVGFVRKPGGFSMKRPITVMEGIALAEGLLEREASPRHCILKRKDKEKEIVIPLDLVAISEGDEPNIYLQAHDVIDVRQTGWKKAGLETLDTIKGMFGVGYSLNGKYR
ncbi:MAG: polysaccharide biosynthesis/export family protein [Planctomycetota bacterium]